MNRRIIGCLLCSFLAAGLAGCDDGGDDVHFGDEASNQDLTQYEDDVNGLLGRTFSGTVEDDGAEIPCRFDGEEFTMTVLVPPADLWTCRDAEGRSAACTEAATASMDLAGALEIDESYDLTGVANLFGGFTDVCAVLNADIPCYRNAIGDGKFDNLMFGEVISQIDWGIQNEEESADQWESCWLNVESIE